ncbi:alpha/beta hydrolase [Chloroflexi bacterium TSY]|nr:alpha/beta hydrolase [Chloroflexi bacterium TSY]
MKQKLRGMKRRDKLYDYDLYRVRIPIAGQVGSSLSVLDLWPEKARDTIMFVHGYAGCLETWEFQINYFVRQNYRVIAPDLRGHGHSDAPDTYYTMPELVADLHGIVETLQLSDRFVLAGHSFGGSICVEYATAGEYPLPRVANLIMRLPGAFFRPWWPYRPKWNAAYHVVQRMMMNNMRTWQGWPLMRKLDTPTLVITGERDFYFPRYVFDHVGEAIPGAEVVDVGSAKHKVQLERHQAVNRTIHRFRCLSTTNILARSKRRDGICTGTNGWFRMVYTFDT